MDPMVGASFIPKKPLAETRGSRGGAFSLLTLLALLVFIASIVAAGASFAYDRYLTISLDSKKASLQKYQDAYELGTIQTLVRFDSRINEARNILAEHVAPSAIFAFLSQQTLEKVQFTSFEYNLRNDGVVEVSLAGVANSFSSVALQSDQLGASQVLRGVVFSDIAIQEGGKVRFTVSATVDRSLILFARSVTSGESTPVIEGTPVETTTP